MEARAQPKVYLARTHERTLKYVPLEVLLENAVDIEEARETMREMEDARSALERGFSTTTAGYDDDQDVPGATN